MLAGMREENAGLDTVVSFFTGLAELFRTDPTGSRRGCLMVNSTTELASRDEAVAGTAAGYRDHLRETFAGALQGELDADLVRNRANLLASTTIGIFVAVRIDPADAADLSEAVAGEVASWGKRPS